MDEEKDKYIETLIESLKSDDDTTSDTSFYHELEKKSDAEETLVDKENKEIINMRRRWSDWILFFIGLIIAFDMILVILYGLEKLSFEDPQVVMVIVTENFLKIIGLGLLITNNLFKKIYKS